MDIKCDGCGQSFKHDSGLREHYKTSPLVKCVSKTPAQTPKARDIGVDAYAKSLKQIQNHLYGKMVGVDSYKNNIPNFIGADTYKDNLPGKEFIWEIGIKLDPTKTYSPQEVLDIAMNSFRKELKDFRLNMYEQHAKEIYAVRENFACQISDLQNQLKKMPSYDPQFHRAAREKTDYTKVFSDEEDGLEDGYNGFPQAKEKVVF